MRILAVETSCDETAIAVAEFSGTKRGPKIRVLSNIISSQANVHAKYGGIVPNLAKREHRRNLVPVLIQALKEAKLLNSKRKIRGYKKPQAILEREPELLLQFNKKILPLDPPDLDVIAVTHGPGLAPALWVGVNFAKALSLLWKKPLIPVNHMAGHLYSAVIQRNSNISQTGADDPLGYLRAIYLTAVGNELYANACANRMIYYFKDIFI